MTRSDDNTTLDPRVERELDAVERALAGLEVDDAMEPIAELVHDIRAERPEPRDEWADELDRRAAAGFAGRGSSPLGELGSRLGSFRLRSLIAPAGALATLAIVAAIGIGVTSNDQAADLGIGDSSGSSTALEQTTAEPAVGGGSSDSAGTAEVAPSPDDLRNLQPFSAEEDISASSANLDRLNAQVAPGRDKRQQDRSAYLRLKAETGEVREVNDEAIQITESVGGVVESANLSETAKTASASLELSIPTRELDATLDRLTDLATVASLDEASEDITKPFVSAQDALADAEAKREQLLQALAEAETAAEADAIQAQIDDVRSDISRAEAAFDNIARRARMADVSLQIEGTIGGGEGADDGSWGLGDAADDALDALKTVAGVMLVGAAIVIPIIALIALLVWLTVLSRRRSREKALDD